MAAQSAHVRKLLRVRAYDVRTQAGRLRVLLVTTLAFVFLDVCVHVHVSREAAVLCELPAAHGAHVRLGAFVHGLDVRAHMRQLREALLAERTRVLLLLQVHGVHVRLQVVLEREGAIALAAPVRLLLGVRDLVVAEVAHVLGGVVAEPAAELLLHRAVAVIRAQVFVKGGFVGEVLLAARASKDLLCACVRRIGKLKKR